MITNNRIALIFESVVILTKGVIVVAVLYALT